MPAAPVSQKATFSDTQQGLKAEYFDNADFTNKRLERLDAGVNFDWGGYSPAPYVSPESYSVRWSGSIKPQYSEEYTFYFAKNSDALSRVIVNGKVVIDNWSENTLSVGAGTIKLNSGELYDISIWYKRNSSQEKIILEWSSQSQSRSPVSFQTLNPISHPKNEIMGILSTSIEARDIAFTPESALVHKFSEGTYRVRITGNYLGKDKIYLINIKNRIIEGIYSISILGEKAIFEDLQRHKSIEIGNVVDFVNSSNLLNSEFTNSVGRKILIEYIHPLLRNSESENQTLKKQNIVMDSLVRSSSCDSCKSLLDKVLDGEKNFLKNLAIDVATSVGAMAGCKGLSSYALALCLLGTGALQLNDSYDDNLDAFSKDEMLYFSCVFFGRSFYDVVSQLNVIVPPCPHGFTYWPKYFETTVSVRDEVVVPITIRNNDNSVLNLAISNYIVGHGIGSGVAATVETPPGAATLLAPGASTTFKVRFVCTLPSVCTDYEAVTSFSVKDLIIPEAPYPDDAVNPSNWGDKIEMTYQKIHFLPYVSVDAYRNPARTNEYLFAKSGQRFNLYLALDGFVNPDKSKISWDLPEGASIVGYPKGMTDQSEIVVELPKRNSDTSVKYITGIYNDYKQYGQDKFAVSMYPISISALSNNSGSILTTAGKKYIINVDVQNDATQLSDGYTTRKWDYSYTGRGGINILDDYRLEFTAPVALPNDTTEYIVFTSKNDPSKRVTFYIGLTPVSVVIYRPPNEQEYNYSGEATVESGQIINLRASVGPDANNSGVTWSIQGPGSGIVGSDPLDFTYIAPRNTSGNPEAIVEARSKIDPTKFFRYTVKIKSIYVYLCGGNYCEQSGTVFSGNYPFSGMAVNDYRNYGAIEYTSEIKPINGYLPVPRNCSTQTVPLVVSARSIGDPSKTATLTFYIWPSSC
ncbi:hypothetical protein GCM10008938_25830 [Deinococcus roseus]|uniref:PA14 domain-containing protein n=2 Tax=Deinococcus roseus TaxID=392414 RepID=A0ABQ2D0D8_9DEIO|nr:hypothetical protein GCM10008938_25830 [Deinococcus roseus]